MGFIPYDYAGGQPDAWLYMEASAIGTCKIGMALTVTTGKLTAATGTTKPSYISMYEGTVASGDVIPVIAVSPGTRFMTTFSATPTSIVVGSKLTIHTDSLQVTATTTGGVAEVSELRGATASGDEVLVFFP